MDYDFIELKSYKLSDISDLRSCNIYIKETLQYKEQSTFPTGKTEKVTKE